METFLNFLVQNWQYISIGLVVLLEIILMIVKNRSKTEIIDGGLYEQLTVLIKEAEKKFTDGDEKLEYVISKIIEMKPYYSKYIAYLEFAIDAILETPTKKGGFGREQIEQKSK